MKLPRKLKKWFRKWDNRVCYQKPHFNKASLMECYMLRRYRGRLRATIFLELYVRGWVKDNWSMNINVREEIKNQVKRNNRSMSINKIIK